MQKDDNKIQKFTLSKTVLNLICIVAICLFFSAREFWAKNFFYNKIPSINFIINTRDLLKNSFVELLLSQISITFLVTSLLSIFGSNEKLIYWENAIEYKLIKPKGQSFKDITIYCLATLPLSVIAIVINSYFLFIASFSINIIGLATITIKMLTIYFGNTKICNEL